MPRQNRKRTGFTLIELLVVISIIAILMALTTAGVMRWLSVQAEKRTLSELLDLSAAADKFKGEFGFYPPSKMVLCSNRSSYNGSSLDQQSLAVIDKMFPSLGNFTGIQWWGGTTIGREVLDGDQCLVFFLGGINGKGFAKAGRPDTGSLDQRFGPFYDFKLGRLAVRTGTIPSYLDPYSTPGTAAESSPYAFFSTGLSKRYSSGHGHLGINEPYKDNNAQPSKWLRPESVQIISAGRDHKFGPGGFWTAAITNPATTDDQSNFHDRFLGSKDN